MSADLCTDYTCAERVAAALAPVTGLQAVLLGGVGDDWLRAPAYPYAVVMPSEAESARGSTTRTIRVRLVVQAAAGASKPTPPAQDPATGSAPVFVVGAGAALDALVQAARDALSTAALGAPLESIATSYDPDPQFPVQSAELLVLLDDPQAYGDSF